jgi:ribokinase
MIVVVGSLNMDLVVDVAYFPAPGETLIGSDYAQHPGGKGANQAVAAARAGGQVVMVGRLGSDGFAEVLRGQLEQDSIDTHYIANLPDAPTGVAFISVDEAAQNIIIVSSGANARLMPEEITEDIFTEAKALILQLEVPLETVFHAARLARAAGAKVILNVAPAQKLSPEQLGLIDVLIVNENEAALLTDLPTEQVSEHPEQAAKQLADAVPTVIVTLGAAGALWCEGGKTGLVAGFAVEAVDTTAAGDAFVGAFAVAYGDGQDVASAVRFANAAGALAATKTGAQPSLPTRDVIDVWLEEHNT